MARSSGDSRTTRPDVPAMARRTASSGSPASPALRAIWSPSGRVGIERDYWIDERHDLERATYAAASYLKDLRVRFGSWEMALAAFNAGYGLVMTSVSRSNTNNFWALCELESGLPHATTMYVPKIVAAAIVGVLSPYLSDHLFRGRSGFVVVFVLGIGGVGLTFFSRGLLAGSGRYHGFAALFLADAAVKSVPALVLLVAGVREPLAYGAVLAASCFVGALLPLTRPTPLGGSGAPTATSALVTSLGFLLLTSFFSSLTINVGTIAVEVLATRSEATEAGVFLSGLVIARIPLFLSQAVQAIVLPRLSEMAASGRMGKPSYMMVAMPAISGP